MGKKIKNEMKQERRIKLNQRDEGKENRERKNLKKKIDVEFQ